MKRTVRMGLWLAAAVLGLVAAAETAAADTPAPCVRLGAHGYCIEWGSQSPAGDGGATQSGAPTGEVVCYWVTLPARDDPAVYADYGLEIPPAGAVIVWQEQQCSDGSGTFPVRWVFSVTPEQTAIDVRARLEGQLAAPVVASSPAAGTASIVGVPVFVSVANWTGDVADSGCAGGICVTVTASPSLRFSPGEPDSSSIACVGAGSRFDPTADPTVQAKAAGACTHVYRHRTAAAGRPVVWPGVVSVSWAISWRANTGESGVLPSVTRSTGLPRGVQEVQTVVIGGSS